MMDDNRLDNIVECTYNMDNGYVEVWYVDGNMLRIKCEEVEAALRTTEQSLAKCQTAHCGRSKPHFDFGENASPIVPNRHLPQTLRRLTADCRSLV